MIEPGTRRGFLFGVLALMTAPAIVRADSLMKIAAIDVYDTRCLWDYNILADEMCVRVDRRLETIVRPLRTQQVPLQVAKVIFGPEHPIFTMRPEAGTQKFVSARATAHELMRLGIVPPWAANVQERFYA